MNGLIRSEKCLFALRLLRYLLQSATRKQLQPPKSLPGNPYGFSPPKVQALLERAGCALTDFDQGLDVSNGLVSFGAGMLATFVTDNAEVLVHTGRVLNLRCVLGHSFSEGYEIAVEKLLAALDAGEITEADLK